MALSVWDENIWHLFGILGIFKYINCIALMLASLSWQDSSMKSISFIIEDDTYENLDEQRGRKTWKRFFLDLAQEARNVKNKV
jgi:hypothetical protein